MSVTQPEKQKVRDYLVARRSSIEPPPTPARIRELLGWSMLEAERESRTAQEFAR